MFCKKCGAELQLGVKFCHNCGTAYEEGSLADNPTSNGIPVQQPVNNGMPSGQPNYSGGQMPVQPNNMQPGDKKKDYVFIIAIVVIGLALIAIPIILNFGKDKKIEKVSNSNNQSNINTNTNNTLNTNSNSGFNTNTNPNTNPNTNTNSNSGLNTNSNSNSGFNTNTNTNINTNTNTNSNSNNQVGGKEATLGNYIFKIPTGATTTMEDESLYIFGLRNSTDIGMMRIQQGDYNQLKVSKNLVKTYMQQAGYTVGDITVSTYNGLEFIVMPVSQSGYSMVCGYAKLSSTEVAVVIVMNSSYTTDYTLLNEMATIVSSARRVGASGM